MLIRLILIILAAFSPQASAKYADHLWDYEWISLQGEKKRIHLTIPSNVVEMAYLGEGDILNFSEIWKIIVSLARQRADEISDGNVRLSLAGGDDNLNIRVNHLPGYGENAKLKIYEIESYIERMLDEFSESSYYRFDKGERKALIEYNKVASDYEAFILMFITSVSNQMGLKSRDELRDVLLDMLQSLTYADLDQDDFPMLNPGRMLIEKRGDCESKQLFMATAMKLIYPYNPVFLVLLPKQEHIVMKYRDDHGNEIYLDATGPDRLPAGSLLTKYNLDEGVIYEIRL